MSRKASACCSRRRQGILTFDQTTLAQAAIRDRLEHAALTLHVTGESYRGVKARKLAKKKKDA